MPTNEIAVLILASILLSSPTAGGPPGWTGSGKAKKQARDTYIVEQQRIVVREYYIEEHRHGTCPPGLAKKRNGCMPPGHAKKWQIGRPLSRDIVYYELPSAVVVKLGEPPPGHRYVRVAADILLIAVGTAMVVGAIEDLGRM